MNHFNRQVKTFNNFLQLLSDLRYSEAMATSEGPRWFDAGERSSWLALIGVVARLGPALDAQLRRAAGVTFFEYTVLAVLSEAPDHMLRMSELAALAEGSLSRLSQAVARMEATGWVRRMPDPEDGRYTLAILTDDGMGKVAASAPEHVEEVRRLVFDPLAKAQTRQLAPPSGIASSRPSTPRATAWSTSPDNARPDPRVPGDHGRGRAGSCTPITPARRSFDEPPAPVRSARVDPFPAGTSKGRKEPNLDPFVFCGGSFLILFATWEVPDTVVASFVRETPTCWGSLLRR